MCLILCSRPTESWGLGGPQPPNKLLKFVDFVSEKGCKSQGRRNEDSNSYCIYSRKLPESIRNAISFGVIQVKNSKFSWKDSH